MARGLVLLAVGATAFAPLQSATQPRDVARFGIFDGVKDAFSQDAGILDEDRVTPFDRWLGIDVRSEDAKSEDFAVPDDFVDSMVRPAPPSFPRGPRAARPAPGAARARPRRAPRPRRRTRPTTSP